MKKRGLGKSLDDLGLNELIPDSAPASYLDAQPESQLTQLPLDSLVPGKYQPRRQINQSELAELADSIKQQGVIQPIIVRKQAGGYEIIAGERRWRASRLAGLTEVPVVVKEYDDQTVSAVALIENIQRKDLNVIEEAIALKRLLEEFDLTHEAVAQAVGKSRSAISNLLRLLNLNRDVMQLVELGELEMGHARALLALEGEMQSRVAEKIIKGRLSVRQTESLVKQFLNPVVKSSAPSQDEQLFRLQNHVSELTGLKTKIKDTGKGRGKVTLEYASREQLDRLLALLEQQVAA